LIKPNYLQPSQPAAAPSGQLLHEEQFEHFSLVVVPPAYTVMATAAATTNKAIRAIFVFILFSILL
jgi:hypothetical protein